MKTIEEKAREYADKAYPNADSNDYSRTTAEEWDSCYDGYIEGYKEATRWRDPINEPPESNVSVFVKYETATGKLKYGVGRYFTLGIGNDWTVEGSTSRKIIGWRPIE